MTAEEARQLARINTPEYKKTLDVLEEIRKAAENGDFNTNYWFNDYYECITVCKHLSDLGYEYTRKEFSDGCDMYVSWR